MKNYTRREFLKHSAATSAGIALAPALAGCTRTSGQSQDPLNILLISIDTVNPFHLGCYGYPRKTTPNLDRFAANSMQFVNALSNAAWTLPSYYSLFTGRYPLGITGTNVREFLTAPDQKRIQGLLGESGYATYFSSELNSLVLPRKGFATDFDKVELAEERFDPAKYSAEPILRLRDKGKFFAFVYTNDAHDPYEAIPYDKNPFVDDEYFDRGMKLPEYSEARERSALTRPLEGVPYYEGCYDAQYDASLLFVDQQLGPLLYKLEEEGVFENTAVIVTADHGEVMAAPKWGSDGLYYSHVSPYRDNIRIPLIARIPGVAPAREETPVQIVDLAPTFCDLAGIPVPARFQGYSLLPLFARSGEFPRKFCYATHAGVRYPWGMIQTGPYKFIAGGPPKENGVRQPSTDWPVRELYDHREDPGELDNLYESRRDVAEDLEKRLQSIESEIQMRLDFDPGEGGELYENGKDLTPEEVRRMKKIGYL